MGAKSSINFKKSNAIQTIHNDRKLPPSYLIGGNFEINRDSKKALALKNKIIKKAIETYNANKPAKAPGFKAKSYEWSAVCNLNENHTMADLEKLAEHFKEKYGFQCYQIAIHRDEGHINDNNEKIINQHAHLEFITLDKTTGKNNYNREKISPKILRQIQDEVAEILGMERGIDKRLSGVKRIEPRKYAQMKEQEKLNIQRLKEGQKLEMEYLEKELEEERLSKKELKERLEQERKKWIEENKQRQEKEQELIHLKEDYARLRDLRNKDIKTISELEQEIQRVKKSTQPEYTEYIKEIIAENGNNAIQIARLTSEVNELEQELKLKNNEIQALEVENKAIKEKEKSISTSQTRSRDILENLNILELEPKKPKQEKPKSNFQFRR